MDKLSIILLVVLGVSSGGLALKCYHQTEEATSMGQPVMCQPNEVRCIKTIKIVSGRNTTTRACSNNNSPVGCTKNVDMETCFCDRDSCNTAGKTTAANLALAAIVASVVAKYMMA